MLEMLSRWANEAKKLEAGEITREEYDHWRYTYPAVEAQRTRDRLDALRAKQKAAETDALRESDAILREEFAAAGLAEQVWQFFRLHQLKVKIVGQTAHVVVGLHAVALQNVGVNRPLGQEVDALQLWCRTSAPPGCGTASGPLTGR